MGMIKKMKSLLFSLSMMLSLPMTVLAAASGYAEPVAPGGVPNAADAPTLILSIINWLLSFLGALAVLMIVVAGIMYITSGGDGDRVDKAKSWLTYAIVGLVVALLGYVIVKTVGSALRT